MMNRGPNTRMVRVTNRTSRPVEVMVDGQSRIFQPGDCDDNMVETYVAVKAIERSPVMGTENIEALDDVQSKLGVAAWGMPVDPIEDVPGALERIDRSTLPPDRQGVVRGIPAGLRQRVEAEMGGAPGRGLRGMATPAIPGRGPDHANLGNVRFENPSAE